MVEQTRKQTLSSTRLPFSLSIQDTREKETHRPFCLRRTPHSRVHNLELIQIRGSSEERDSKHEFGKDTSDGPDVDGGGVGSSSKEEFGGSVPSEGNDTKEEIREGKEERAKGEEREKGRKERRNSRRDHLGRHLHRTVSKLSRQTEISYLEDSLGGDEQVVGFEILDERKGKGKEEREKNASNLSVSSRSSSLRTLIQKQERQWNSLDAALHSYDRTPTL